MRLSVGVGLALLGAALAYAAPAPAQSAPQAGAAAEPPKAGGSSGPNRAVLGTGVLALILSYVPAVVVASGSNVSADKDLYAPVAGPWIDLASRPSCGPGAIACNTETGNKVLLIADGLFQAWGLIATAISFVVSEHPSTTSSVTIAPTPVGAAGGGLTAVGRF
jgi:hypothetical protein